MKILLRRLSRLFPGANPQSTPFAFYIIAPKPVSFDLAHTSPDPAFTAHALTAGPSPSRADTFWGFFRALSLPFLFLKTFLHRYFYYRYCLLRLRLQL